MKVERWGFEAVEELPSGYCSRVWANETRVLKVPFQGEEMTTGLVAALRMAGQRAPRVFASNPETGALLMERLKPGSPMKLPDHEALPVFAELFELHASLPSEGLMPVEAYCKLDLGPSQRVFLHGDLHHENVLRHGDEWWAIDPKGLEGDPCFAASAVLRNPSPGCEDLAAECLHRLDWFHHRFCWDPLRMITWAVADAGEDGEDLAWVPIQQMLARVKETLSP